MADFKHYATLDEGIEIIRDVMRTHSLRLIPNHSVFEVPTATTYDQLTSTAEAELRQAHSALLEGDFTVTPVRFLKRNDAEQTYYIDVMSGPRLHWVMPRESSGATRILAPGSLILLNSYLMPSTDEWLKPSEALKRAYKDVITTFKKHMSRVSIRKGDAVWVGKQTELLLDNGSVRSNGRHQNARDTNASHERLGTPRLNEQFARDAASCGRDVICQ